MRTLQLRHALAIVAAVSLAACAGAPVTTSSATSVPGAITLTPTVSASTVPPSPIATASTVPPTATGAAPTVTASTVPATAQPSRSAAPTGAAPTSSPSATLAPSVVQQGMIAFVIGRGGSDAEVHVVAGDGSVVAAIPRPTWSKDEAPTWDHASKSLLFSRGRTGKSHLFRYDVATATVTQLTYGDHSEGYAAVSPDGSTIAFDNATEATDLGIWLMDRDGFNRRELVPPPPPPAVDSAPAFSPDGTRLAFIRKYSATPPNAREAAFIVNVDGTGLRRLTDPALDVGRIRWSPDGTHLAFSDQTENRDEDTPQDIWLIEPDGSGLHRITHNTPGTQTFDPDWSPDGSRFVVLGWRKGDDHNTIATMNADGTDLRQIYAGPPDTFLGWPAWGAPRCPNPYDGGSCRGTLSAGTYRTTVFELPITYTVADGWQNFEDLPGNFLLIPPGEDFGGADYISVGLHAVPLSRDCSTEATAVQPEPGIAETPMAIATELRKRPGLLVTEPRKIEIGGLTGVVVDVRLDPTWTGTCFYSAPNPAVPMLKGLPPSDFEFSMIPGIADRLYLLANGDTTLQIAVEVGKGSKRLPELAAIAEHFRFGQ